MLTKCYLVIKSLERSPKKQSDEGGGLLGMLKRKGGSAKSNGNSKQTREREHLKLRKVPIKVEPKVYFANERTFLAWLHTSIILAATSISIVAFSQSNPWSQIYGILLLPCAIAFILYALRQCKYLVIFFRYTLF